MSACFERIFSFATHFITPPEAIGEVPGGARIHYHINGGVVTGEYLQGHIMPVGTDCMMIRKDGVGMVDVRSTIKTTDGAVIYMTYTGVVDFGANGYEDVLHGTLPSHLPVHTAPVFQTCHPNYRWLNRLQCFGVGCVEPAYVSYDIYAAKVDRRETDWDHFAEAQGFELAMAR